MIEPLVCSKHGAPLISAQDPRLRRFYGDYCKHCCTPVQQKHKGVVVRTFQHYIILKVKDKRGKTVEKRYLVPKFRSFDAFHVREYGIRNTTPGYHNCLLNPSSRETARALASSGRQHKESGSATTLLPHGPRHRLIALVGDAMNKGKDVYTL